MSVAIGEAVSFGDLGVPADLVAAPRQGWDHAAVRHSGRDDPRRARRPRRVRPRRRPAPARPSRSAFRSSRASTRRAKRQPTALVLAPTRELTAQICRELEPLAATRGLRVCSVYGGVGYEGQRRQLNRGVDVLVACPGRLADLLRQDALDLEQVAGRGGRRSRSHGRHGLPARSAAPARPDAAEPPDDVVLGDARRRDRKCSPAITSRMPFATTPAPPSPTVAVRTTCSGASTVPTAPASPPSSCRRRARPSCSAALVEAPTASPPSSRRRGVRTAAIHGGRSQNQRDRALATFKVGRVEALVATDVAARGIHVDGVACVVALRHARRRQGLPAPFGPYRPRRSGRPRGLPGRPCRHPHRCPHAEATSRSRRR